jgi:hypothetical protein
LAHPYYGWRAQLNLILIQEASIKKVIAENSYYLPVLKNNGDPKRIGIVD